ncbi:MAG: hypothetical protein ABH843_04315 [Candidatus Omnitrophota bacterium]
MAADKVSSSYMSTEGKDYSNVIYMAEKIFVESLKLKDVKKFNELSIGDVNDENAGEVLSMVAGYALNSDNTDLFGRIILLWRNGITAEELNKYLKHEKAKQDDSDRLSEANSKLNELTKDKKAEEPDSKEIKDVKSSIDTIKANIEKEKKAQRDIIADLVVDDEDLAKIIKATPIDVASGTIYIPNGKKGEYGAVIAIAKDDELDKLFAAGRKGDPNASQLFASKLKKKAEAQAGGRGVVLLAYSYGDYFYTVKADQRQAFFAGRMPDERTAFDGMAQKLEGGRVLEIIINTAKRSFSYHGVIYDPKSDEPIRSNSSSVHARQLAEVLGTALKMLDEKIDELSKSNSALAKKLRKIKEIEKANGPMFFEVVPDIGYNAANMSVSHRDEDGRGLIVLDMAFVDFLVRAMETHKEAAAWVLLERVGHELCHTDLPGDLMHIIEEFRNKRHFDYPLMQVLEIYTDLQGHIDDMLEKYSDIKGFDSAHFYRDTIKKDGKLISVDKIDEALWEETVTRLVRQNKGSSFEDIARSIEDSKEEIIRRLEQNPAELKSVEDYVLKRIPEIRKEKASKMIEDAAGVLNRELTDKEKKIIEQLSDMVHEGKFAYGAIYDLASKFYGKENSNDLTIDEYEMFRQLSKATTRPLRISWNTQGVPELEKIDTSGMDVSEKVAYDVIKSTIDMVPEMQKLLEPGTPARTLLDRAIELMKQGSPDGILAWVADTLGGAAAEKEAGITLTDNKGLKLSTFALSKKLADFVKKSKDKDGPEDKIKSGLLAFMFLVHEMGHTDIANPFNGYGVAKEVTEEAVNRNDADGALMKMIFEDPSLRKAFLSIVKDYKNLPEGVRGYVGYLNGIFCNQVESGIEIKSDDEIAEAAYISSMSQALDESERRAEASEEYKEGLRVLNSSPEIVEDAKKILTNKDLEATVKREKLSSLITKTVLSKLIETYKGAIEKAASVTENKDGVGFGTLLEKLSGITGRVEKGVAGQSDVENIYKELRDVKAELIKIQFKKALGKRRDATKTSSSGVLVTDVSETVTTGELDKLPAAIGDVGYSYEWIRRADEWIRKNFDISLSEWLKEKAPQYGINEIPMELINTALRDVPEAYRLAIVALLESNNVMVLDMPDGFLDRIDSSLSLGAYINGRIMMPKQLVETMACLNERGKEILAALIDTHRRLETAGKPFELIFDEELQARGIYVQELDLMLTDMANLVRQVSEIRGTLTEARKTELTNILFDVAHTIENSPILHNAEKMRSMFENALLEKFSPTSLIKATADSAARVLMFALAPALGILETPKAASAGLKTSSLIEHVHDMFRTPGANITQYDVILLEADIVNNTEGLADDLAGLVEGKDNIKLAVYGDEIDENIALSNLSKLRKHFIEAPSDNTRSMTVISKNGVMPAGYREIGYTRYIMVEGDRASSASIIIAILADNIDDIKELISAYCLDRGISSDAERDALFGRFDGSAGITIIKPVSGGSEKLLEILDFVRQSA